MNASSIPESSSETIYFGLVGKKKTKHHKNKNSTIINTMYLIVKENGHLKEVRG